MFRLCAALVAFVLSMPVAEAERRGPAQIRVENPVPKPVPAPAPASVTLREGVLAASLTFELGMSRSAVMEPASIAPDVSYGVTDNFTFAIIHSSSALTGFRGSAGSGFCLTGTEAKCRTTYAGGGVEALYSVTKGSAAIAANVGVVWPSLEPTVRTDLKVGFKMRLSEGRLFALFTPNAWFALDDRDDRVMPHEHQLFFPLSFWVKPTASLALGLGTGVKGPVEGFAQRMSIPAGLAVQLAVDKKISLGSSFVFGKVYGGSEVMDAGMDARAVQVWLNLTSN